MRSYKKYINCGSTIKYVVFQVREHPLYHLINAKVNKDQGNVTEAIKTLQAAMTLANSQVRT